MDLARFAFQMIIEKKSKAPKSVRREIDHAQLQTGKVRGQNI